MYFSLRFSHRDNQALSVGVLPDPSCVGQALVWSKLPAVLTAASVVIFLKRLDTLFSSHYSTQRPKATRCIAYLFFPIANLQNQGPYTTILQRCLDVLQ